MPPAVQRISTGYRPHRFQAEVHRGLRRFSVVVAHRRFGKTILAIMELIDRALRDQSGSGRYGYVAPYLKQAKETSWDYLKRFTNDLPQRRVQEAELAITLHSGARIRLYGADNADAMRGGYFDFVVIDEVADMKPEVWGEIIRPMLADRRGGALFIGTPKGQNLLAELFHRQDDGWYRAMYRADETALIADEELELARSAMSENQFRQEFLCDWSASADNVLIPIDLASAAARRVRTEADIMHAPIILGVDIARYGCFDDQTEILTDVGWKLFSDLTGAERVLTLNGDVAEWGPIEEIHKYPFVGDLNYHDTPAADFAITDNHRLLVRSNPRSNRYVLRRYDELAQEFLIRAGTTWSGVSPETYSFATIKPMPYGGEALYRHAFAAEDWAAFLGWFVSEGNVYQERREYGRLRVLIAQRDGPKKDQLLALLDRMGIRYRHTSTRWQVEFTHQAIGRHLLEHCGSGASNKRVPSYLKEGSPAVINAFLEAFLLGDGTCHRNGNGRSYVTSSRLLADDIQEMLAKVGRAGMVRTKHAAGSVGVLGERQLVREFTCYVVYERGNPRRQPGDRRVHKRNVERRPYSGFVWCVSTPHQTIYVRRNGVPMWSGNSDRSVIIRRQGLQAFTPLVFQGLDNMQVAGHVLAQIQEHKPDAVFIDAGRGEGVIDRLRMLGQQVVEVHFGGKASSNAFANKRSEMWDLMRKWLEDGGAIPNEPDLKTDLCGPTYDLRSGQFALERKEDMTKRGLRSPDQGDSLALTFAFPVMPARLKRQQPAAGRQAWDYDPLSAA